MTSSNLVALLPLIVPAAAAVIVMLAIAFFRDHTLAFALTLAGFVLSLLALPIAVRAGAQRVTTLLVMDGYSVFFMGLVYVAGLVVALLAHGYLDRLPEYREEFYVLLLLATLGSAVLVASSHFASFFLGLEILSVSLYALIAYPRGGAFSVEAGIKYLVLAAASAAFLLFGMALVYAETGTMDFAGMTNLRNAAGGAASAVLMAGFGMMVIGFGFKLAVVPFHMWTPDVYEGAPAPVTAFVATVSKGGVFALLLRYFSLVDVQSFRSLFIIFTIIAIASMLIGNLLALRQRNVKRILAYSSISHLGYMLVAFLASGASGVIAVAFYLTAYFITTLAAFGVLTVLSRPPEEAMDLPAYAGLFWRRPWLAAILTAALLSLAGIPLTAGFVGKFFVLAAGINATQWLLCIALVVGSAIGLYYYLRIIVVMYEPEVSEPRPASTPALPLAGSVALAAMVLLLVWLGVYPAPFIHLIQVVMAG